MTLSWLFRATTTFASLVFSSAVRFLTFFLHFMAIPSVLATMFSQLLGALHARQTRKEVMGVKNLRGIVVEFPVMQSPAGVGHLQNGFDTQKHLAIAER